MLFLAEAALQLFYRVTVGQWLFTRTGLPLFVPDERFVYWNKPHMSFTHRTNEFTSEIATNGQGLRAGGARIFRWPKSPARGGFCSWGRHSLSAGAWITSKRSRPDCRSC